MIIEISNQQTIAKVDATLLRRGIRAALKDHGPAREKGAEVSVALVDDEEIARLHALYMNDPQPTDVITFPLTDADGECRGGQVIGEIVISVETARREAKRRRKSVASETLLYAVHGALHLAGYDDQAPEEARVMKEVQEEIVARILKQR